MACIINPDIPGEARLLVYNRDREEFIWHPVGPLPFCPVEGMEEVQDHTTLHAQSQSCAHPDKGPLFLTHTTALTYGLVVA